MVSLVSIAKIVVIISCRNWGGAGAGSDVWKRERKDSPFPCSSIEGGEQGTGDGQEFYFYLTCVKHATSYLLFVHGMNFGGGGINILNSSCPTPYSLGSGPVHFVVE